VSEGIEGIEGNSERRPGGTRDSSKVKGGVPTKGVEGGRSASERRLLVKSAEHGRESRGLGMGIKGRPCVESGSGTWRSPGRLRERAGT